MTLGNMRNLGVRGFVVYCLNHNCRHETVIGVDDYADNVPVPWFGSRMVCTACGMICWLFPAGVGSDPAGKS
jgi:hypothetical protein